MRTTILNNTDSYKCSHYNMYPKGTTGYFGYMSARDKSTYNEHVVFGLQGILQEEILDKIPTHQDIAKFSRFAKKHGVPFNKEGWLSLIQKYPNRLPITIRGFAEGSVIPVGTPCFTVECTDSEFWWVASWVESILLRAWYPMTVATISYHLRKMLGHYLNTTQGSTDGVEFMLHDFGARGCSSPQSAARGGAAHLLSFSGSDTILASSYIEDYYLGDISSSFSVPAAEHSTVTSYGDTLKDETEAYKNIINSYPSDSFPIISIVADSYDIYRACKDIFGGSLKQTVIDSKKTLVIRPDSGDALEVLPKIFDILADRFGVTVNEHGFKRLQGVKVLQGDGVNPESIKKICQKLIEQGYCVSNMVFGMGGALLQKLDRDTLGFALKMSARRDEYGMWKGVKKNPITQSMKKSIAGKFDVLDKYPFSVVPYCPPEQSAFVELYNPHNGIRLESFEDIRKRVLNSIKNQNQKQVAGKDQNIYDYEQNS